MKHFKGTIQLPAKQPAPPVGSFLNVSIHGGGSGFAHVTGISENPNLAALIKLRKPFRVTVERMGKTKLVRWAILFGVADPQNKGQFKGEPQMLAMLDVTTKAQAQALFERFDSRIRKEHTITNLAAATAVNSSVRMIREAERKYWKRLFPVTHNKLSTAKKRAETTGEPMPANIAEREFDIEIARQTGRKLAKPIDDVSELAAIAPKVTGKIPKRAPIDGALLDGFKNRGFAKKNWPDIAAEVGKGNTRKAGDAIRKRCTELGLFLSEEVHPGPRCKS
jgi:hypothetical protein